MTEKRIHCRKGHFIGVEKLDGQILVLENGLPVLNCLFYSCKTCGSFGRWISEDLPGDAADLHEFKAAAAKTREKLKKSLPKTTSKNDLPVGVSRVKTGFRVRYKHQYIGIFPTVAQASKAYENAKIADSVNVQKRKNPNENRVFQNKLGLQGVSKTNDGQFAARLTVNGKRKFLGNFPTAEDARTAYVRAKATLTSE